MVFAEDYESVWTSDPISMGSSGYGSRDSAEYFSGDIFDVFSISMFGGDEHRIRFDG